MNEVIQILAWPGAFAAVAIAAFLIFKSAISDLFGRAQRAKWKDGEIDLSGKLQVEAQQKDEKPEAPALPVPKKSSLPSLPPPSPVHELIEAELRRRILEAAPEAPEEQFAWALRVAATATVERNHESIYRVIFGSQIAVLKQLNVSPISVAQARSFYDRAAELHPEVYSRFPFESWGDFLLHNGLAALEKDPPDPGTRIHLTPTGKDFLFFMTGRGLYENKFG